MLGCRKATRTASPSPAKRPIISAGINPILKNAESDFRVFDISLPIWLANNPPILYNIYQGFDIKPHFSGGKNMDELVKLVSQKTGLPIEQAKVAVQTVLDFLKQKLPAPIAGQIDAVLAGSAASEAIKGLGNLF
jgi:hypothetical protein